MTKKIEIRFHQQPNGKEPVRDWLLSQPKTHKRVIGADLKTNAGGSEKWLIKNMLDLN